MPKFYKKKPVVVEAIHILPLNEVEALSSEAAHEYEQELISFFTRTAVPFQIVGAWTFEVLTLEGKMLASPGDWLIRGVKNEVYPCKDDIFQATYDEYVVDEERLTDALISSGVISDGSDAG